jgi:hypothetical protein
MIMQRAARAGATATAIIVAVTGCSQVVTGSAQRSTIGQVTGPAACTKVDAPLQDLPARASTEPKLRLPQPSNWKRIAKLDRGTIRYVMSNPALFGNMFMPNVVVTLEKAPPLDAQSIYTSALQKLRRQEAVSDVSSSKNIVCGLPAVTVTYHGSRIMARGRRTVTTLEVVAAVGARQYLVTVSGQTADPSNQTYVEDLKTILTGFQVLAPTI